MKKRIVVAICIFIALAGISAGIVFAVVHTNNMNAEKERIREITWDLLYADRFNFTSYIYVGSLAFDYMEDPTIIDRVEFREERPTDFEYGQAKEGVAFIFPTETTAKSLDVLNRVIERYAIDAASYGFSTEITMHDIVYRRKDVQALVDGIRGETPEDTTAIKRSIYYPQ